MKVLFFFLVISTTAFSKAFYVSVPCSSHLAGKILQVRASIDKTEKYLGLAERQEKALRETDLSWMQQIAFETNSVLERLRGVQRKIEHGRRELLSVRPFPDWKPMIDGVNHEIRADLSSELARQGLLDDWFGLVISADLKTLNRLCFVLESYWYLTTYRLYFFHRLDDITPSALKIETHDLDYYGPASVFAAKQLGPHLEMANVDEPDFLLPLHSEMLKKKELPKKWREILLDARHFIRFFKPAQNKALFGANQVIIKGLAGILVEHTPRE